MIEQLLDAGLSFREISWICRCSHGSVGAQKKEWLAKKAAEKKKREEEVKLQAESIELPPEVLNKVENTQAESAEAAPSQSPDIPLNAS